MMDLGDLLAALHDLTNGAEINPRDVLKKFNLLLNQRDSEIRQNIIVVLGNFQPSSVLEKLLRTKLIDRYKVTSETWNLLLSNDSLYVNQAMKFKWFFSNNEDTAGFLQNTLPKLSYSTRLKILNRYALRLRDNTAGEAIYIGVKARYGISTAVLILPACSEPFIQNELHKIPTTLPRSVLMSLLDKHPAVSAEHIAKLVDAKSTRKHKNINHYKCAFVKLSDKDFSSFLKLLDNHGDRFPKITLGRRQLKKLLKSHLDLVVRDFEKFVRPFCEEQLFHRLTLEQFIKVYSAYLPLQTHKLFQKQEWDVTYRRLGHLKPSLSPVVFASAFQMKYNSDCNSQDILLEFPHHWLQHFSVESRVRWVDAKISEISDPTYKAQCLMYLPVDRSLPQLENLMTSSHTTLRSFIASCMIQTLAVNDCPSGVKNVVLYLLKRFRNETSRFKQEIISKIADLDVMLLRLDLDHWAPILELLNSLRLSDRQLFYCDSQLKILFGHLIHKCMLNNVDALPYFQQFVEFGIDSSGNGTFTSDLLDIGKGKPFEKVCIEWFIKTIPAVKPYADNIVVGFLKNICNYNRTHKHSAIEMPDWLIEDVQRIVGNPEETYHGGRIMKILRTTRHAELYDRLLEVCSLENAHCSVLWGRLKRDPNGIRSNMGHILDHTVKKPFRNYSYFYRKCRVYVMYGIPNEMIKHCLSLLEQKVFEEMDLFEFKAHLNTKSHAVKILAYLQDPSTYLDLCSKYIPSQQKINSYSKEVQMEFTIQCAICESLTGVANPLDALPLLTKFTGGDYLKIVCGSLIGVCVRIPENKILPILEERMDCPVSLRKHILRLTYNIAPIQYSIAAFVRVFGSERNSSLRLVLFLQIRDCFINEPTDESYKTFISIVQQLTVDDKEILDKLFDIVNVHEAYISQYIKLIWQLINSEWKNVLPNGKKTLIDAIDVDTFKCLTNDVSDVILEYELSYKLPASTLSKFVCYYLLYNSSDEVLRQRVNVVMDALGVSIKMHWAALNRSGSGFAFPIRHVVSDVISSLCAESAYCEEPARAASVLTDVKTSLLSLVTMGDVLQEAIQLDVYSLHLTLKASSVESTFATALAELYSSYIERYGSKLGYSLIHHLTPDVPMVSNTKLAHELLKNHSHPTCHILATEISSSNLTDRDKMPMYKTIINTLASSNTPEVRAAAAYYFKNLQASTGIYCDGNVD